MWLGQRAGGVVVPLLTALVAFLIGGVVVARDRPQPARRPTATSSTARASTGSSTRRPTRSTPSAYNLSQTLLQTTTLILTGLAVAFAFRCGMFNIGGQGQYFVGLYVGRSGSARRFAGMATLPHVAARRSGPRRSPARSGPGSPGFLKATVGAHEVISTIMLNWIAIWVGTYLFGLGGAAPEQRQRDAADLERRRRVGAGCPCSGATRSSRACTSASSSRSPRSSSSGSLLNRTTLGYEVRAVGFNPDAARVRRHQRRART